MSRPRNEKNKTWLAEVIREPYLGGGEILVVISDGGSFGFVFVFLVYLHTLFYTSSRCTVLAAHRSCTNAQASEL